MADARHSRLHAHETNALGYGHLGTASYDRESHEWTFLRQPRGSTGLEADGGNGASEFQLIDDRIVLGSAETSNAEAKGHRACEMRTFAGFSNAFFKKVPDAAIVSTAFPSSDSGHTFRTQEQLSIHTLALASARSQLESDTSSIAPATALLAMTTGTNKEILQLTGFTASKVTAVHTSGLDDRCTVPSLDEKTTVFWSTSKDSILHVAAANQAKGTRFVMVKSSGTTILRPLVLDARPEMVISSASETRSFDPCPILTIPVRNTGGSPHIHAAFNPRDQRLIAIVDISGQCSTWKLGGTRSRSARVLYQAHLQGSSSLRDHASASAHGDGWHQICWLNRREPRADHILVCSRRYAAVFDESGKFLGQVDMRLGPPSARNKILQIKHSQHLDDQIFVLTTSRLLVFSSKSISWKKSVAAEPLDLVFSWNHFRDRGDQHLKMSLFESQQDAWILVYSSSSHVATIYHFGFDTSNSSTVSLEDPTAFQLPQQLGERSHEIDEIFLSSVDFKVQDRAFSDVGYTLVKLFAAMRDGKVLEVLYRHHLPSRLPAAGAGRRRRASVISLPELSAKGVRSPKYITEEDSEDVSDIESAKELKDFVVTDTAEAVLSANSEHAALHRSTFVKHSAGTYRNWQSLLDRLDDQTNGKELPFEKSLQTACDHLENAFLPDDRSIRPFCLLSDNSVSWRVSDVEEDNQHLQTWLGLLSLRNGVEIASASLPWPSPENPHASLNSVYNDMIDGYVQPLSHHLTDRNRINRERLVRQVTGPVFSGSWMLKHKCVEGVGSPETDPGSTAEREVPYPTPAPEVDDPGRSPASTSNAPVYNEEPAVTRLRQYARFVHSVPPLLLEHSINSANILGHLPESIQANPDNYSYQNTNHEIKLIQDQLAAESLDPKQRMKALKSAARLQMKLERNQLMSREINLQRSMLPTISTVGLSTLPGREIQSSQAAAPGSSQPTSQVQHNIPGLTMTQPERGHFGTRQAAKKSKKRRAGF